MLNYFPDQPLLRENHFALLAPAWAYYSDLPSHHPFFTRVLRLPRTRGLRSSWAWQQYAHLVLPRSLSIQIALVFLPAPRRRRDTNVWDLRRRSTISCTYFIYARSHTKHTYVHSFCLLHSFSGKQAAHTLKDPAALCWHAHIQYTHSFTKTLHTTHIHADLSYLIYSILTWRDRSRQS